MISDLQFRHARTSNNVGFTLVEVVLALTLSSLLLASLLGVVRILSRELAYSQKLTNDLWKTNLLRLLRRDLMCTSHVRVESNGWIQFQGEYLDFADGAKKKSVSYRCVPDWNGGMVLIRMIDSRAEPVAANVERFAMERIDDLNLPQPLSLEFARVPERLRIWLWSTGDDSPSIVEDFVLY
jgi:hypothetical protein